MKSPTKRKRAKPQILRAVAVAFAALVCVVAFFGARSPRERRRRDLFHASFSQNVKGMKRALDAGADPNARFSLADINREIQAARPASADRYKDEFTYWRYQLYDWPSGRTPERFTRGYYAPRYSVFSDAFASALGGDTLGNKSASGATQLTLLLERGANPNQTLDGFFQSDMTPLWVAAQFPDAYLTRLLLRYGSDPALPGHKGETPLHAAVRGGDKTIVALIRGALAGKAARASKTASPSAQPNAGPSGLQSGGEPPP